MYDANNNTQNTTSRMCMIIDIHNNTAMIDKNNKTINNTNASTRSKDNNILNKIMNTKNMHMDINTKK